MSSTYYYAAAGSSPALSERTYLIPPPYTTTKDLLHRSGENSSAGSSIHDDNNDSSSDGTGSSSYYGHRPGRFYGDEAPADMTLNNNNNNNNNNGRGGVSLLTDDLPDDVLIEILQFNGPNDYRFIGGTSKRFKRLYQITFNNDHDDDERGIVIATTTTTTTTTTSISNAMMSVGRRKIYEDECPPPPLLVEDDDILHIGGRKFRRIKQYNDNYYYILECFIIDIISISSICIGFEMMIWEYYSMQSSNNMKVLYMIIAEFMVIIVGIYICVELIKAFFNERYEELLE